MFSCSPLFFIISQLGTFCCSNYWFRSWFSHRYRQQLDQHQFNSPLFLTPIFTTLYQKLHLMPIFCPLFFCLIWNTCSSQNKLTLKSHCFFSKALRGWRAKMVIKCWLFYKTTFFTFLTLINILSCYDILSPLRFMPRNWFLSLAEETIFWKFSQVWNSCITTWQ